MQKLNLFNTTERNHSKRKTLASITMLLILTLSTLAIFLPTVSATDFDTYAFLSVAPSPIGVGQNALVTFWLDKVPPLDASGWTLPFEGYEVKIIKPSGTIETKGPFNSDAIASQWFLYSPDEIGTYVFQFSFPGQTILDRTYLPSTSPEIELVVQQEPIEAYQNYPLPTANEYWDRPIEAENRDWWSISGNWLGVPKMFASTYDHNGAFNPYSKGPNTGHIVWTKPNQFGGLVGGNFGSGGFYTGLSYESKFLPPVIMSGVLYYNLPLSNAQTGGGLVAVNLRTGEEIWQQDATITCGQLLDYDSPNQHGIHAYLWSLGSTSKMYDAFSGTWLLDIANSSYSFGSRVMMDPSGDLLVFNLDARNNVLSLWNATKAIPAPGTTSASAWNWRPPVGAVLDGNAGIEWEVSIPDVPGMQSFTGHAVSDDVLIASTLIQDITPPQLMVMGYSTHTGEQLWAFNITTGIVRSYTNFGPVMDGVFTYFKQETMTWYGYDVYTGEQLWESEPYTNAWGTYMASYAGAGPQGPAVAYGNMYATAYDGRIHCHDMQTGEELWTYYVGSSGFETPYGTWPFYGSPTIADGKVYAPNNEHSPSDPIYRGGRLHCVNAETGEKVWDILGWYIAPAIADGYMVSLNYYDGQVYCFGKGQTSTTVTGPETIQPLGAPVLFKGTVTDQSPGAEGTPAIADDYMSEWMEYLYMQKPCPQNVEGVEVVLTTLDPNGNFYEVGTTTSDANGCYSLDWVPPVPGKYTIYATFEGSESYFRSVSETAILVSEASSASQQMEPELTPMTSTLPSAESPLLTIENAIISTVAVACIIGVAAFLTLRKRK